MFNKKGKSFDFSPEKESNIAFFGKILDEIGEKKALESKIFTPLSLTIDQSKWLQAVGKIVTRTDEGSCDDLAIMDTYISEIVRWVNEVGIPTDLSCDGYGRKNPSVILAKDILNFHCG